MYTKREILFPYWKVCDTSLGLRKAPVTLNYICIRGHRFLKEFSNEMFFFAHSSLPSVPAKI